ncbi:MAG TPA: hypothetical protein VF740_01200, partial [Candidatus Acidoferrum sp.]
HGAGSFNGKARPQDQSKCGNENEHEGTHYDVLRNGHVGILRLDVKELKNCKRQRPEIVIYQVRDGAEMLFHL